MASRKTGSDGVTEWGRKRIDKERAGVIVGSGMGVEATTCPVGLERKGDGKETLTNIRLEENDGVSKITCQKMGKGREYMLS
ncbi:hypothetical protein L1887_16752 [Cichorium endivia]|nr:hypothetical protein L1887_16752 [Cichorium endivia]